MVSTEPPLILSGQAWDALHAAAKASRRNEQGGVLIGWRLSDGLFIQEVLRIRDADAGPAHYKRSQRTAQHELDLRLRLHADKTIGYVGEWHTHPMPAPPSSTDRNSMRMMALRNRQPVALIVAARRDDTNADLHCLISPAANLAIRAARPYKQVIATRV